MEVPGMRSIEDEKRGIRQAITGFMIIKAARNFPPGFSIPQLFAYFQMQEGNNTPFILYSLPLKGKKSDSPDVPWIDDHR